MKTPIAFLIFNRPDTTEKVFDTIRQVKPQKLLVVADGPRTNRPGEAEKCQAARSILERIDWNCELVTNFSDMNLGCRLRVSSGLDWVFQQVEEAIVLEDDCLPHPTFFQFCEELLARYRYDSRVMQICGSNVIENQTRIDNSYYFSKYGPIWGWASWRRAWRYYDVDMKIWPEVKQTGVYHDFCDTENEASYRIALYDKVAAGEIDTWDYQWGFAKFINSGLSIIPKVNLISNIGYGQDATHTHDINNPFANLKTSAIELPLTHPLALCRDKNADKFYSQGYLPKSKLKRAISKIKKLVVN